MENRNATATTAASETDHATCYFAIELSRWTWVVAVHTPLADRISLHKLKGRDVEGLLALVERTRTKVEKALGKWRLDRRQIAAPRTVNHELLGRSLDELAELCAGDRSDETIRLLRHLVPEYHEEQIKSRAAR